MSILTHNPAYSFLSRPRWTLTWPASLDRRPLVSRVRCPKILKIVLFQVLPSEGPHHSVTSVMKAPWVSTIFCLETGQVRGCARAGGGIGPSPLCCVDPDLSLLNIGTCQRKIRTMINFLGMPLSRCCHFEGFVKMFNFGILRNYSKRFNWFLGPLSVSHVKFGSEFWVCIGKFLLFSGENLETYLQKILNFPHAVLEHLSSICPVSLQFFD